MWIVTQRALIRTASGKEGGRDIQTEAITRAWHEGLQKPMLWRFILRPHTTGAQTTFTIRTIAGTAAPAVLVK